MVYRTYYELTVDDDSFIDDIDIAIGDTSSWLEYYNDSWSGESKWYDHDEEMLGISKRFPTVLFTLTGDGEDREDLWVTYYKGGKKQHARARITYEPFNEAKLV